jgi:hypothetical protein
MHEAIAHNEHGYQSAPRALPACMYRSFQHSTFLEKKKQKKREKNSSDLGYGAGVWFICS